MNEVWTVNWGLHKLKLYEIQRHKSPGIEQIPAELIKAEGRTIRSEIRKIINSIWNKEELPEEWKEFIIVPIYKKGDKTCLMVIQAYYFCYLCT